MLEEIKSFIDSQLTGLVPRTKWYNFLNTQQVKTYDKSAVFRLIGSDFIRTMRGVKTHTLTYEIYVVGEKLDKKDARNQIDVMSEQIYEKLDAITNQDLGNTFVVQTETSNLIYNSIDENNFILHKMNLTIICYEK